MKGVGFRGLGWRLQTTVINLSESICSIAIGLPAASAIQKTSKMAKVLVRREKQNRASGSLIEPEVFSAHIANICSSEEQWNGDMRRFVPQWSFRNHIESAILA